VTTGGTTAVRRRLLADIRPLRESREYRRLWIGSALSGIGSQMTAIAIPVQVYTLTRSSLAVGLLGLAAAVPLLVLGLLGGSLADAVDRRRLVLVTTSLLPVVSLLLAVQALADLRQLWLLYLLAVAQSCLFAVDTPARAAFTPRLLPPDRMAAASALSQLSFQVGLIGGPLLAGVVIAGAGPTAVYLVDVATFVGALYGVLRLRPMPVERDAPAPGLRAVIDGLRFLRHQPVSRTALLADLNAAVFGMPHALFPALALTHFGGGYRTVGVLYSAPAIGGLLGAAFSGPLSHIRRQGRAMLLSVSVWGTALACFALTPRLAIAVPLLAVAGAADVVTVVFRSTILQVNTPDPLLGRISGVSLVVGEGGPRLGDVEAGVVAALTSPMVSAVSGGIACVVGAVVLAVAVPAFGRYDAGDRTG